MKKVVVAQYGDPQRYVRCIEAPDIAHPGEDEVLFDVLAFPINPADISFCWGRYRLKPELPAVPGAECIGQVVAVGTSVRHISIGDLVINLDRENWTQRRLVKASRVIVVPKEIDVAQAAMMRINPPTAHLLLSDVVKLGRGDWIIQNAANSAVGRMIIAFAKERGINTVNVVRRDEAREQLLGLGVDVCLTDSEDLASSVKVLTNNASIVLGIDAVAGSATNRIASCVADGGVVCTYGSVSRESIVLSPSHVVYRGLTFTGFLLGRFLDKKREDEVAAIYQEIFQRVTQGLRVDIERVYPIENIVEALAHADRARDGGKILVAPHGPDRLNLAGATSAA
ncbi:MDR family NADPH-dependent oxidoreductase [Pandoraea pnomenusa]|uniref:MDR family NADPH-dependent oxidoreductase n=1 Tax=Pandoraea pnomenusa TaxID=93220 RepID=UPI0015EF834E|nr:2-enoyl thioester reductase domain-containing protein [Pandoraea pnomenusa]